jgi:glycosyltransferase involved in cell wall biosynthesis
MIDKKVKISIGLPVYNGEKYIKNQIESIISQTYKNLEIIISDNASIDNTENICKYYANKDKRIKYIRNEINMGATPNFNQAFSLSTGKYFKWAHSDDVHHNNYIEKCLEILESDDTIVLCHTLDNKIDKNSKVIGEYNYPTIDSHSRVRRFNKIISMKPETWMYNHGLIRSDMLKLTRLYGKYLSADRVFLAELALLGRFHQIQEPLFLRREHEDAYTNKLHDGKKYMKEKNSWWGQIEKKERKISFPYFNIFVEYFRAANHILKSYRLKLICYLYIIKWLIFEGLFLTILNVGITLLSGTQIGNRLQKPVSKIFEFLGFS